MDKQDNGEAYVDEDGNVFVAPGFAEGLEQAAQTLAAVSDDLVQQRFEENIEMVTDDEFVKELYANYLAAFRRAAEILREAAKKASGEEHMETLVDENRVEYQIPKAVTS